MTPDERNKKPLISIITPSFNQGAFLERTLQSVLTQDYDQIEHIVIDGGSKDNSRSLLEKYDRHLKRWVSEPDGGQTHAVNKGLQMATGDIIGWLNSDDVYYPETLRRVVDAFSAHPTINFLYGMADHIDIDGTVIEPYHTEAWDYERLQQLCFLCQPAVFFRRHILVQYGLLDESLEFCMDYEYWLRCGAHEPFHYLEHPLAGSRLHPQTKTLGAKLSFNEEIVMMLKGKLGKAPNQWIFSLSLAQANELKRRNRLFANKVAFKFLLWSLWQKNLIAWNGRMTPILPDSFGPGIRDLAARLRLAPGDQFRNP